MASDIILKNDYVEVVGGIQVKQKDDKHSPPYLSVSVQPGNEATLALGSKSTKTSGKMWIRKSDGSPIARIDQGFCNIKSRTINLHCDRLRLESSGVVIDIGSKDIRVTRKGAGRTSAKSFNLIKVLESLEQLQQDILRQKIERPKIGRPKISRPRVRRPKIGH